ncbi:hypothetical protein CR203_08445 [Salipaludibacillus neizhouensis]|uniref:Uncharacterized protein n=1 Tax=Salipaludibacillus neizhouensis TaxID=885475 RepID=A0A3A9KCN7_9BACI|nr:hypothetical protein [Salipaludibacillus neizhouensis]RKL67383.1 hypothetical protein CR203_08445 [Salipaludibacillus neizhouensis]
MNRLKDFGWIKGTFIIFGSVIGFIGLTMTLIFFLLLWMDKYDNRYIDSEEAEVEKIKHEEITQR